MTEKRWVKNDKGDYVPGTKETQTMNISFSVAEWDRISDGIDKLLDFEAKQSSKTITSEEFAILEALMRRTAKP